MQDTENKISWIEQLEVTGPINSIMGFVDDLSINYERRVNAMHADYQKDIEELITCYKQEKEEFQSTINQLECALEKQTRELKALTQSQKSLVIAHKITEECLANTREELDLVNKELATEKELVKLAQEQVQQINQQLEQHQEMPAESKGKVSEFIKLVSESKITRDLMLAKYLPNVEKTTDNDDSQFI